MRARYTCFFLLAFGTFRVARAADISVNELKNWFCTAIQSETDENLLKAFPGAANAKLEHTTRAFRSSTAQRWEARVGDWRVKYSYQISDRRGNHFGFEYSVTTFEPQKSLVFDSEDSAKSWLGQFGSVYKEDDDFKVALKGKGAKYGPDSAVSVAMDESTQTVSIEWFDPEDKASLAVLCR